MGKADISSMLEEGQTLSWIERRPRGCDERENREKGWDDI